MYEDRKFQDGDYVVFNSGGKYSKSGTIEGIYTYVNKSRGDYAYNVKFGTGVTPIWGADLTHAMYKYDPNQQGDTEEDI